MGTQRGRETSALGDIQSFAGHSPEVGMSRGWSGDACQPQLFTASGIYRGKLSVTVKLSFRRSVFIMRVPCFMNCGVSEHSLFRKSLSSNYTRS